MNRTQKRGKSVLWSALLPTACMVGCAGSGSGEPTPPVGVGVDVVAPTVSATSPSLGSAVATNANVKVLFSEAMDSTTITTTSFTLTQGSTPIPGAVSYDGNVAILNPTVNLAAATRFTATMNTGARDVAGNSLALKKTWTFSTRIATAAGNVPILSGSGI